MSYKLLEREQALAFATAYSKSVQRLQQPPSDLQPMINNPAVDDMIKNLLAKMQSKVTFDEVSFLADKQTELAQGYLKALVQVLMGEVTYFTEDDDKSLFPEDDLAATTALYNFEYDLRNGIFPATRAAPISPVIPVQRTRKSYTVQDYKGKQDVVNFALWEQNVRRENEARILAYEELLNEISAATDKNQVDALIAQFDTAQQAGEIYSQSKLEGGPGSSKSFRVVQAGSELSSLVAAVHGLREGKGADLDSIGESFSATFGRRGSEDSVHGLARAAANISMSGNGSELFNKALNQFAEEFELAPHSKKQVGHLLHEVGSAPSGSALNPFRTSALVVGGNLHVE